MMKKTYHGSVKIYSAPKKKDEHIHSLSRPGPWKKSLNGLFSLLNM